MYFLFFTFVKKIKKMDEALRGVPGYWIAAAVKRAAAALLTLHTYLLIHFSEFTVTFL